MIGSPHAATIVRIGIAWAIGAFAAGASGWSADAPRPPNLVLILADDLGYGDLGAYGQKEIQTPHLDRLAAGGLRFTQAYAGSSVCAPARSALMTGLHNGHGRVRDNVPHGVHLQPGDLTVAEVLQRAGYRTGAFGKWSLGDHFESGAPWRKGFDEFFGYPNQDHAHFYYPHFLWDHDRVLLLDGNRPGRKPQYAPDLMIERALGFLAKAGKDPRPFFLYFPSTLPHWSEFPRQSPESHAIPDDAPYTTRPWPPVEKNYAAMVTRLDHDVGRLVAKLDEIGVREHTLILFTSDNGPSAESVHDIAFFRSAGGFRGHKRLLYEGGVRVPLIANWPGVVPAGRVDHTVCGGWDILPTFAELAGQPVPPHVDGISLAPVLRGRPLARPREFLYWDYGHTRSAFQQAVRTGDWKAVRGSIQGPIELYDLSTDPGETRDVASRHPAVVERMRALMARAYVPSPDYPIAGAVPAPAHGPGATPRIE